jgi:hypothetical protein
MRVNQVIVMVGRPHTGKTQHIVKLIAHHTKRVIVYDVQNEKKYQHLQKVTLADLADLDPMGKYRLFHADASEVAANLYRKAPNSLIVFEDATSYIDGSPTKEIKSILVGRRHRNQDLIFPFHSLKIIPPKVLDLTNLLAIRKTNDNIAKLRELDKLPNRDQVIRAWERVQRHPNEFHYELVTCHA